MTSTVVAEFGVSHDDVTTESQYIASGSLDFSVDTETSEDEVANAVVSTLADLLNVHQRDLTIVSVDLENGELHYEIASSNYAEAAEIQSNMDSLKLNEIESQLQELLPSAEIGSSEVNDFVEIDISIVVDGSDAGDINEAKRNVTQILSDQGFEVITDVTIVKSAPTVSPTFTTMVPSTSPSITGIIVTLSLATTESTLSVAEVGALEAQLAEGYGVSVDDVTIAAEYTISGMLDLENIPNDISSSELEEIVEQSIANALGVHPRNVETTANPTTSEVSYSVTSADHITATDLQTALNLPSFADELTSDITTSLPNVSVQSINADDEIEMKLEVTIDATESTTDIEKANAEIISEFEDQGFSIDSESTNNKHLCLRYNFESVLISHET